MTDDTKSWDDRRGGIWSSVGGFLMGQDVQTHGHSLLHEFVGKRPWMEVYLLHATGRMPDPALATWVESVFHCLSYPDHRIWCNQMASMAGTLGASEVGATCAGLLASDAVLYGVGEVFEFSYAALVRLRRMRDGGMTSDEVVKAVFDEMRGKGRRPSLPGFSRPLINGDERLPILRDLAQRLGFARGEWETFAYELDAACRAQTGDAINLNAHAVSFMMDRGYDLKDIRRTFAVAANAGILACYVDTCEQRRETFLPLRVNDVVYEGRPPRRLSARR